MELLQATSTPNYTSPVKPYNAPTDALLERIALCESGGHQFNPDGSVVHGRIHYADTGKYQINAAVHLQESIAMGMDINTLEGNTAFAKYLYRTQGVTPWLPSKNCWG